MMKKVLKEDEDFAEKIRKLQKMMKKKKKNKENWFLIKNIENVEFVFFIQKTVFSTKIFYSLKNSVIFNLSSMIYIFNEIIQFLNFQSA